MTDKEKVEQIESVFKYFHELMEDDVMATCRPALVGAALANIQRIIRQKTGE